MKMKRFLLLSLLMSFMASVAAQTVDSVAVRLYTEAENAYSGTNGAFLNKEKAMQLFIQAAERNYIPAIHKVAAFYNKGEVVEKNLTDYLAWMLKAAELGDAYAQNIVGVCYHDAYGTAQDIDKALYWYLKAAAQGNVYAMNNLRMYYDSQTNVEEVIKWARAGAEHGHVDCQIQLAGIYNKGVGVKQDADQAIYWYKMAADQGHATACNLLAVMYHDVKNDFPQALQYVQKAAELGSVDAFYNLGYMYELGEGTAADFAKAEQCYLKSIAVKSDDSSRFRLGVIYYEGRLGVKKDKKKGEALLKEAATGGSEDARKYLDAHKVKWTLTVNGVTL